MHSVFALVALAATSVLAEDRLVSRRLTQDHGLARRGLSADNSTGENFNITLFHINDIHAHLDEITTSGTDCDPSTGKTCYGGYARIKAAVDQGRTEVNNSLFLDVGDEFQGTLFYTFYGGEKIAEAMNIAKPDLFTLGNHEFDAGEEVLGEFLQNLTMPTICANVNSSEPNVNATVKPYHVFEEHQLAVIAVTTDTIPSISNPSDDTTFSDPIATTQYWVDYINENEDDVERIVVMTHIGYAMDRALAANTTGVYAIVGAHSHTLLLGEPTLLEDGTYNNTGDADAGALGSYPTIIDNLDGDEVFVVTAYRYGEYLGHISLEFDSDGKVMSYVGAPIHLQSNNSIPGNETVYNATVSTAQDPELLADIKEWRGPFEEYAAEVIGETSVVLDQTTCQDEECTFGDFACDAMLSARQSNASESTNVVSCIINAGGIRATIDVGPVTRGQVLTAFPFGNTLAELTFSGSDLRKVWEGVVSGVSQFTGTALSSFAQTSNGTRVTYDPDAAVGSRLVSLKIGDEEVEDDKEYTIVTLDFVAGGGDSILPASTDYVSLDPAEDAIIAYINQTSPIDIELDGRIAVGSAERVHDAQAVFTKSS